MTIGKLVAGAALVISTQVVAAPPKAVLLDFSSAALMDPKTALQVMDSGIPPKVWRVYPRTKWGYVSQVEGGLTSAGICVVTARVMMVPLTPTMKAVLFRPEKVATSFDAVPGSNSAQCRDTAKSKLIEATQAVVSSLVRT